MNIYQQGAVDNVDNSKLAVETFVDSFYALSMKCACVARFIDVFSALANRSEDLVAGC
jgi:hypothetical protein